MKRSLHDKYNYNKGRKDNFANGYCFGVTLYKQYPKMDNVNKQVVRELIDMEKELARGGDPHAKGTICGYRDAANDRKRR